MVSFKFYQQWLQAVSVLFVIFGLYVAFLSWSPLFGIFDYLINGVFWPGSGADSAMKQYMMWSWGMIGGAMAWLGIMIFAIARYAFPKKEKWSRNSLAIGMIAWFVVDSFMSAYTKAYFNVLANAVMLVLAGLPLLMTWKEFKN